MTERIRKASNPDLIVTYLRAHIGQWVPHDTLRQLTGSDDVPRTLRDLRQAKGYPIEFDRKGNSRLLPEQMQTPRGERGPISPRQRIRILDRDGSRCQLCGIPVNGKAKDGRPARMEIDHVIPVDKGGPTEDWNLRALCHVCNHDRNGAELEHDDEPPAPFQTRFA